MFHVPHTHTRTEAGSLGLCASMRVYGCTYRGKESTSKLQEYRMWGQGEHTTFIKMFLGKNVRKKLYTQSHKYRPTVVQAYGIPSPAGPPCPGCLCAAETNRISVGSENQSGSLGTVQRAVAAAAVRRAHTRTHRAGILGQYIYTCSRIVVWNGTTTHPALIFRILRHAENHPLGNTLHHSRLK